MSGVQYIEIGAGDAGRRLDRFLRERFPALNQGRIEKMLRKGEVRVDGAKAKSNTRLEEWQTVRVPPVEDAEARERKPRPRPTGTPEDAKFLRDITLYEDDDMIALNKPPGLPVQGGSGQHRHIDGMLGALAGDGERPKLVHRIDKDTSGLLLLAKHGAAARALAGAFKSKAARKLYWGAVLGEPKPPAGTITYALMKSGGFHGEQMVCLDPRDLDDYPDARRAMTDYARVDGAGGKVSWVVMRPVTGRTHQLRAHMAEIGCSIVGDGKYGPRGEEAEKRVGGEISRKLHLHARRIRVPHPNGRGGMLELVAPLPEHMARTWELFAWDEADGDDPELLPDPEL